MRHILILTALFQQIPGAFDSRPENRTMQYSSTHRMSFPTFTMKQRAVARRIGSVVPSCSCSTTSSLALSRTSALRHESMGHGMKRCVQNSRRARLVIVHTYPEPETEKERSPIDIPQEWITPEPSRRPDIFPEFERLETPLPKPLPGDPEVPDEEEEEEEEKKKKNPDDPDEDDDENNPDEPAPSEE